MKPGTRRPPISATKALQQVVRWYVPLHQRALDEVCAVESSPARRARLLVVRFAEVHRVGEKLATMFVSALSTPTIARGLSPWFPLVDGNELVVVDTNVARAVDVLRESGAARTYRARADWLRHRAAELDLREFGVSLPRFSARFVQEALYKFCSSSNRRAAGDTCATRATPCSGCVSALCPFGSRKGASSGSPG